MATGRLILLAVQSQPQQLGAPDPDRRAEGNHALAFYSILALDSTVV
jgi:hypothetical protein